MIDIENFTTVALAFAIVVLSWMVSFVTRKVLQKQKPFSELPMPPHCHWLLGHAQFMGGDEFVAGHKQLFNSSVVNEHGQVGYWILFQKAVALTHWEDVKKVCMGETHREPFPMVGKHLGMLLGYDSLVLLTGKRWKRRQATIKKTLTPKALLAFRDAKLDLTNTLVNSIKKRLQAAKQDDDFPQQLQYDVSDLLKMVTFDIFGKVGFSVDFQSCENLELSPFATAFDFLNLDAFRRLNSIPTPSNYFYSIPTEANREYQKARDLLRSFIDGLIAQRRHEIQHGTKQERQDFKSTLLRAQEEFQDHVEGDSLSDQAINDMLMTLLVAGYHTTATALTFALYLIAQHPEMEALCVQEIQNAETLTDNNLWYCRAVMIEALRLFPPVDLTARSLLKPVELQGGVVLPVGTMVAIPIWTTHRAEHNFPRPHEFLPERWCQRSDNQHDQWVERQDDGGDPTVPKGNQDAFLAFTTGARACPGQKFAMQETVIVFAGLLKELRFSLIPGYECHPIRQGFTMGPKHGMPMNIQLRN